MLFVLGLIVGSFLNVLIYRLPRGQAFVLGRSLCTHCKHELASRDLIPLISYLWLGGKCRYCSARISLQYPIIELTSALIFTFAPSIYFIIILELLLVIAVIDYQHLIIPDSLLVVMGLVAIAFNRMDIFSWSYIGSAIGLAGFFFLLWFISHGAWIGFGDVKLAGVLGLVFGFPGAIIAIYLAIILGGAIGMLLLLSRRASLKTKIPFGSLMAVGCAVYIFFSGSLLTIVERMLY